MKERKQGVAKRTLLVGWSGWKLAIMRREIMVRSDKHLAILICFGEKLDMEGCMKSVVTATAAFPNCRAMLWSVVATDVNLVEVTMIAR